jgi:hypothetical protein
VRPGDRKAPQIGAPLIVPRAEAWGALQPVLRPGDRPGLPVTDVRSGPPGSAGQSAGPPGFAPEPKLIHEPGGDIARELVHPSHTIYENLYRVLPDESWYAPTVSPSQPVQFEFDTFVVPPGMHLWLRDYEFTIFRQSGIDAGDYMPAEEGRFSGVMGFDVNFTGKRLSNLLYQLDPVPTLAARPTYQPPPGNRAVPDQFDTSAAQSFAANASPGTSLLPVRRFVQGAREAPFTLIAREGDTVSLNVVIFRPVPTPLATIQGRSAGFLMHSQVSLALIERLRPR